jgi:ankyrin repeat protein
VACERSSPEVVEFLLNELDCERYINVESPPSRIAEQYFLKGTVEYGIENWKAPPLHTAVISDSTRIFKLLLDHGADARQAFRILNNHFRFSLDEINFRSPSDGGKTALELAVLKSNVALVEELLKAGASWDMTDTSPTADDSALRLALKQLYNFRRYTHIDEGFCPTEETQYQDAFARQRRIALVLARKARDHCACGAGLPV